MISQVIKYEINNNILFELLEKICKNDDNNYYILNKVSFKLAMYHNYIQEFCSRIVDNYYISKQYYVTRKLDYCKFTTIIRQICKANNINFTSKILYDKSNYDITYYVYNSDNHDNNNNNSNNNSNNSN